MHFLDLDLDTLLSNLLRIVAAFVLTLPLAWERERHSRTVGLRTFPLVAVASCGFILVGASLIGRQAEDAQARLLQGLMAGIGFIGGGAILKGDGSVSGTATAASIWATGAVGAAAAYDRFEIAFVIALVNFGLLRLLSPVKEKINNAHAEDE